MMSRDRGLLFGPPCRWS